jgi:radical SAM superfamily enzyme YgiQ (UPF0313 family)
MIDVLFLNPGDRRQVYQGLGDELSAVEPPVFARLFAHHARLQGRSVVILDMPAENLDAETAAARVVEEHDARLVVIAVYGFQPSASTQNMTAAGKVAAAIKALDPARKVLMTGTHPAALPERTLREEAIDFVVDLEGPVTIVKLSEALAAGATDFSGIPSLWWKDAAGELHAPTRSEALVTDLDHEMPPGGWDLLDMSRYRAHNWHCFDDLDARAPYASVHTSLGCPYHCAFCCINAPFGKPSYRMWSPDAVVGEIDHLVTTYGVKNIKFVDEMFVLNPRHVLGICDRLIARGHDLNIWAYARIDTVQDRFLEKLRAAGVRWLALGIEAADSTVRDGSDKRFDQAAIRATCDKIRAHGIRVIANYIFGLPDDTPESMQATLDMALDINAEFANFYSAMAYPGSKLYTEALASGAQLPARWHDYSQHGFDALPLANARLTSAEILAFRDHAFQTYFGDPRYHAMIAATFGPRVLEHIHRMRAMPLPRRAAANGR